MKKLLLSLFAIFSGLSAFAQNLMIQDTIDSKILGQTRRINILIPDTTLAEQTNGKMNVVYVLDGSAPFVNIVGANLGFISSFGYNDGVPPFLVVGIDSEETRRDDFFIKSDSYQTGRADEFIRFLSDEVFPLIESRYNVTSHRVGVGHSLGGSLLFRALTERDSLFNAYLLFSPNLVYGKGALLKNFKAKKPETLSKFVYISNGDTGDMEQGFAKGVRMLDSLISHTSPIKDLKIRFDYPADVQHHESLPISMGRAAKEYIRYSYLTPNDSVREAVLAEADYPAAIKRYYEGRQSYMGYLFYPAVYGFYNVWVDFANENKQPEKALQAVDMAIEIHNGNTYQYFLHLAKARILNNLNDQKAALEACDDAMAALKAKRDKFTGYEEDYQYCEEEIADKVAEIKAPRL